ncbi:MAG: HAD hydrolase-like protein [Thermodesulfovibrionales bacterium]|nr:HAD hydrolase-like protein [Thermodesulfovibrionales bacterium]
MITIIFDVDDTLVDSMHFDIALFIKTIKELLGDVVVHDDWRKFKNVTDSGILDQIIDENNISDAKEVFGRVRKRFGELVMAHLEANPCKPKRGAISAINELNKNKNYIIGFATGGWRHTALMKLKSAGFSIDESTLFSSDDHHERIGIMNCCKNRIAQSCKDIVYVGDGEWDLEAAAKLQWGFIGIGDRLKGKTKVWIEDFISEHWESAPSKALQRRRGSPTADFGVKQLKEQENV